MNYLPKFPPTSSGTECFQLRGYETSMYEPLGNTGVWELRHYYAVGYWHFEHSKKCIESKRSCGAFGWLYWAKGNNKEDAIKNLKSYFRHILQHRMPEQYRLAYLNLKFL